MNPNEKVQGWDVAAYPAPAKRQRVARKKKRTPLFAASPILIRYLGCAATCAALACSMFVSALSHLPPSVISGAHKRTKYRYVPGDFDDRILAFVVRTSIIHAHLISPVLSPGHYVLFFFAASGPNIRRAWRRAFPLFPIVLLLPSFSFLVVRCLSNAGRISPHNDEDESREPKRKSFPACSKNLQSSIPSTASSSPVSVHLLFAFMPLKQCRFAPRFELSP
ncbi:hypothetical protein V8C35DRAFT_189858 [Trichoderma chlorosporum]